MNKFKLFLKNMLITLLTQLAIYLLMFVVLPDVLTPRLRIPGSISELEGVIRYIYVCVYIYILPVVLSSLVIYKYRIKLIYWFISIPFLFMLIMLYHPEGIYELPITGNKFYALSLPLGAEVFLMCFKFFILQIIITLILAVIEKLKGKCC